MRKYFLLLILFLGGLFLWPRNGFSDITAPWSTTFNCQTPSGGDWNQTMGISATAVNCDGIAAQGNNYCDSTHNDQIISAANNSAGGGGKGWRHWVGDGHTVGGAGISITFTQTYTEYWFSWNARYTHFTDALNNGTAAGFTWGAFKGEKTFAENLDSIYSGYEQNPNYWALYSPPTGWVTSPSGVGGWNQVMGTPQVNGVATGDGKWHWYEYHLKKDTNGTDGVFEVWIDGIQILSRTNLNMSSFVWNGFALSVNFQDPLNGGCVAEDFDDMALSTTGYIGRLSPPVAKAPPAPPKGFTLR